MKPILKLASFIGLVLTIVPSFLVMSGRLAWSTHANLMFVGMILWFATAPFWMKASR